jgi:hypothetical protein
MFLEGNRHPVQFIEFKTLDNLPKVFDILYGCGVLNRERNFVSQGHGAFTIVDGGVTPCGCLLVGALP